MDKLPPALFLVLILISCGSPVDNSPAHLAGCYPLVRDDTVQAGRFHPSALWGSFTTTGSLSLSDDGLFAIDQFLVLQDGTHLPWGLDGRGWWKLERDSLILESPQLKTLRGYPRGDSIVLRPNSVFGPRHPC
jgi:hypothetical protein